MLADLLSRLLDLAAASALLLLLSPLLALRAALSLFQARRLFDVEPLVGRLREPFERLRFAGRGPLRGLAVWLNVLRGDMAVVGPRALVETEAAQVPVGDLVRFAVRPGLISPFALRKQVGIAHAGESALDREFVYAQSLRGDVGLAARSMITGVLGGGEQPKEMPPVLNFFGVPVVNTSMAQAVDWLIDASAPGAAPSQLAFVNPDCLNIAWSNEPYRQALVRAQRVLPDGIGIHIGCRMLGQALRENVNGTDMFPLLCEAAAGAGRSIYLLGARPGIAAAAAESMRRRYPSLRIAGTRDGYFDADTQAAVIKAVNDSGADILLVAFGAPRQDLWIAEHRDALAPRVCFGVGGLFDFYSGRIARAPVWMREIGLEWLYRLLQEPGRMWRRYVVGNPLFLFRVWRQVMRPERFALAATPGAAQAGASDGPCLPSAPGTRGCGS
jgi:N-acetylglucosaminyldiphosphoundecaprenol N-acetyl-beta-D-mannosaminyltransferase